MHLYISLCRFTTLLVALLLLTSCGGGDDGGSGATVRNDILEFDLPDYDVEREGTVTGSDTLQFAGSIHLHYSEPDEYLNCNAANDGVTITHPAMTIKWKNLTGGTEGSVRPKLHCWLSWLTGFYGTSTRWWLYVTGLEIGENNIVFNTYKDGNLIGKQNVTVRRGQTSFTPSENTTTPPPSLSSNESLPSITYVSPEPYQQFNTVSIKENIVVLFSEAIWPDSLTGKISVRNTTDGFYENDKFIAEYHPATNTLSLKLKPNAYLESYKDYQVTVYAGVLDADGDGELENDITWSFETGGSSQITSSKLLSVWPPENCRCPTDGEPISIEFDAPLDPGSINENSIQVQNSQGKIEGQLVYQGRILEFYPSEPLPVEETYIVTLDSSVTSLSGKQLNSAITWNFEIPSVNASQWQEIGSNFPDYSNSRFILGDGKVFGTYQTRRYNSSLSKYDNYFSWFMYDLGSQSLQDITPTQTASKNLDWATPPILQWSGSRLLSFSGASSSCINDSCNERAYLDGLYDPSSNTWSPLNYQFNEGGTLWDLNQVKKYIPVALGSKLLIWGPEYGDGQSYTPTFTNRSFIFDSAENTWALTGPSPYFEINSDGKHAITSDPNTPPRNIYQYNIMQAAWTGTDVLFWGKASSLSFVAGKLDVDSGEWSPFSLTDAPLQSPYFYEQRWDGSYWYLWNSDDPSSGDPWYAVDVKRKKNTYRYDPTTDQWTSFPIWAPTFSASAKSYFVDTGNKLVFVGIKAGTYSTVIAWSYDKNNEQWSRSPDLLISGVRIYADVYNGRALVIAGKKIYQLID